VEGTWGGSVSGVHEKMDSSKIVEGSLDNLRFQKGEAEVDRLEGPTLWRERTFASITAPIGLRPTRKLPSRLPGFVAGALSGVAQPQDRFLENLADQGRVALLGGHL